MSSKTYRCYLRFQKPAVPGKDGVNRNGKTHYIVATNPNSARDYVERRFLAKEIRKGEQHIGTVASAWKEDRALRKLGAKELPLKFD